MLRSVEKIPFGMEQPKFPDYKPEVVSWWMTPQWKTLLKCYDLEEVHFEQTSFGAPVTKPTTWGGSLKIEVPDAKVEAVPRKIKGKTKQELVDESKALARWPPAMMRAIAIAIQEGIFRQKVHLRKLSWREHVMAGHTPFRKDCRVCQEACGKEGQHRRSKLPPKAGVLSIDVTGPFRRASDLVRGEAKYMLVGAFTWPSIRARPLQPEPVEEEEDDPRLEDERTEDEEGEVPAVEDPAEAPAVEEPAGGEVPAVEDPAEAPAEEEPAGGEERREEDEGAPEQVPMDVIRLVVPMASRQQGVVLKSIIAMYLQLRADGFEVRQLHSDRAREFCTVGLEKWCAARSVLQTWTPGDQPQSNGRAEQSVGEVKSRIRRLLKAASLPTSYWPVAARFLNEQLRAEAIHKKVAWPSLYAEVWVGKRGWNLVEMGPTSEKVRYLGPSWLCHGHWIEKPDGKKVLTRMVFKDLKEVPDDAHPVWVALEEDLGPLEVRRRLRGKTTVRAMQVEGDEKFEEEERNEEVKMKSEELKRLEALIQDETVCMAEDDKACLVSIYEEVTALKALKDEVQGVENQVLQTRIVSQAEVRKNPNQWIPSIKVELSALFEKKQALKKIPESEALKLVQNEEAEVLPGKMVFTVKPEIGVPTGKNKSRIVACGNFAEVDDEMELYANGSSAIALRFAIAAAMKEKWHAQVVDVKNAFLNAPMKLGKTKPKRALMRPPQLLQQLGLAARDEWWEVVMALYGYRQSPRLWSDYRDSEVHQMKVDFAGGWLRFDQMLSEPGLWKIVRDPEDAVEDEVSQIYGALVVYVDDIVVFGSDSVVQAVVNALKGKWELSVPQQVNPDEGVRFLGADLWRFDDGAWMIAQRSYTKDLLAKKNLEELPKKDKRVPISKEEDPEEEEHKSPEDVRAAQKAVGELVWLVTRTRPDLMFATSKMASFITKAPKEVSKMAVQVWSYLKGTIGLGLKYEKAEDPADDGVLQVFSDASYGVKSWGCFIIKFGDGMLMWKAGRQHAASTSTAEAELYELMEAVNAGESVRVLIEEFYGKKILAIAHTDSASALSITTGDSGAWKTRHLRLKAAALKWRVQQGDWVVKHRPGDQMPADAGTKVLTVEKFQRLRMMLGMKELEKIEEKSEEKNDEKSEEKKRQKKGLKGDSSLPELKKALQMIVVAVQLMSVKAMEDENGPKDVSSFSLFDVVMMYTVAVVLITVICMRYPWRTESQAPTSVVQEEDSHITRTPSTGVRSERGESEPTVLPTEGGESEPRGPSMESVRSRGSEGSDRAMTPEEFEEWVRNHREEILRCAGPSGLERDEEASSSGHQGTQASSSWLATLQRLREEEDVRSRSRSERRRRTDAEDEMEEDRLLSLEERASGVIAIEAVGKGKGKGKGKGEGDGVGPEVPEPPALPVGASLGVYITQTGAKYHLFATCSSLTNTRLLRRSPPCADCAFDIRMIYVRGGRSIWSNGRGQPYHQDVPNTNCRGGRETLYEICGICWGMLRERGWDV